MTEPVATNTAENGIGVWEVGDGDYIAATSQDEATSFYQKETGFSDADMADMAVEACNIDACRLQVLDADEKPTGETVTFREGIKRDIAAGLTFPCWFASSNQ